MKYKNLEERIIANSVLSLSSTYNGTACWEWIGRRKVNKTGEYYGHINIRVAGRVKSFRVHRLVLSVFRGIEIPYGDVAMHLCNNTICCNPMHLAPGTQAANMRQCVAEGRHGSQAAA